MELRHLRYFVAVAETKHFGRAAERLHLAQPALSQAVRQLEAQLGTSLLTRTTRQVSLTPAGEFFHAEARKVLDSLEASVHGVRRIAEGRRGLLRIAFTGTAAHSHLPLLARLLKEELPDVVLQIEADRLTPEQTRLLAADRLDLGVLRPPVADDRVRTRTLQVEHLVLAVASDHPLASAPTVTVPDLAGQDFVAYDDDHSVVNEALARTCRTHGFTPGIQHKAPGTSVLLALVAAGLGVSLVPESVRTHPPAGVVFRDVPDTATTELALAWRRDTDSPLVLAAVAALEQHDVFRPSRTDPTDPAESEPAR